MMYIRYPLSLRQVADLLFERGIDICHEDGAVLRHLLWAYANYYNGTRPHLSLGKDTPLLRAILAYPVITHTHYM